MSLEERIDQQETWTFHECLGLSTQYNVKVRAIIAMVYQRGKHYIDSSTSESN